MNAAMEQFVKFLQEKSIKYTEVNEKSMKITYGGKNVNSVSVIIVFGDDCQDVQLAVLSIVAVPEEKRPEVYRVCSENNMHYRWVKFYLDSDGDLTADADAIIRPGDGPEICFEMLLHIISIVDKAYPSFMKAMWA